MSEEPLRLESIKECGIVDSELARKLYDILNGVLPQNSSTEPAVAVNQINDLVPSRQAGDTEATYGKSVEGFLWTFWELVLSIAKLAPHGHSSKTKVVHIVENLSRVSLTTTTIWGKESRVWEDLPLLGPCMRESWISPSYDGDIPDEESTQRWINLNSFAAELLGRSLVKGITFAVWELREALEDPAMAQQIMDCRVTVAAQWIFQAGDELFRSISEEDISEDDARVTEPGALYQGRAGLCSERWQFWKRRFSEISGQLSEETQKVATSAAEMMAKIEGSQGAA